MSTWLPFKRGNPELTPVKLCAKSHGQTSTASVLFSKIGSAQAVEVTWKCLPCRTPYGGSIALIMYSAMHTTWVMTADLNGSTMDYSSNSFKRSEYVKCKSHAMLFELNKQISNFPEWLIWHLGQWVILWSWLWPSEWIFKLIWKHMKGKGCNRFREKKKQIQLFTFLELHCFFPSPSLSSKVRWPVHNNVYRALTKIKNI